MSRFNMRVRGNTGAPADTTPDAFVFTDVSGKTEGATVTGAPVTITGINAPTSFTVTGGEVQKNGTGAWLTSGTVVNNDTLTPRGVANVTFLGTTNVNTTVGGISDTFTIQTRPDPVASFATVGPAASYNGTAGSGTAPPAVAANRAASASPTTPMAIGQIATSPGQRTSGLLLLKIPCDAYGGVAQVNLSGDCAPTTISTMGKTVFTDVNGIGHTEFYHAVYLDSAAFVAKGGSDDTRRANIYAEIVPTLFPSVQKRLLSFHFLPASAATDGTYDVGAGRTYATLKAALSAAQAASKKAPLITIYTTGFYEMEDSTWGIYAGGHGFAVITHDAGVTARIRRAADFSPNDVNSWKWTPGWDGIEFRGSGIVIDTRNTIQVVMSTKPCLMNGCKVTNSIGTRDSLYWNKGPHPGWGITTPSFWQYHDFEFGPSPFIGQLGAIGGTSRQIVGDMYSHTPLNYGNHDENSNADYFRQGVANSGIPSMTVRYSGAGTATIAKTGGNGGGWLVLDDGDHPSAPLNIDLGGITNYVEISTVAGLINARSGWVATVQDTTRGARYFRGFGIGDVNGFTATDAKTADVVLATFIDVHGDGTQTYGGEENFIYWNWTLDTAVNLSNVLFFDGQGSTNGDRDMSFVNCVLLCDGSNAVSLGGTGAHHKLFRHLTTNAWVTPGVGPQEIYTEMTNCIVAGIGTGGDPAAAPAVHFRDNLHTVPTGASMWVGPTFTGNVNLGNAAAVPITNFLANPTAHDFTPISTALTTLYPNVFPYDQRGVLRSANDSAGAWSKNPFA